MKKVIGILILGVVFVGGGLFAYNHYYGGDSYYTVVPQEYKYTEESKTDSGKVEKGIHGYEYNYVAYDEDGNKTEQKAMEWRAKPLRVGAYLKLKVNKNKGVMGWAEVEKSDVPTKALDKLEK